MFDRIAGKIDLGRWRAYWIGVGRFRLGFWTQISQDVPLVAFRRLGRIVVKLRFWRCELNVATRDAYRQWLQRPEAAGE